MKKVDTKNSKILFVNEEELTNPYVAENISLEERTKARKALRSAWWRGFRYCEACFMDKKFLDISVIAHPTDGHLNWGRGSHLELRRFFYFGKLIPDPFYRFTKHGRTNNPYTCEFTWFHEGLKCKVYYVRELGHRCGYVRIPKNHPWFNKSEDNLDVQVHGGLTYGGKLNGRWGGYWVGFDCAHCDDAPSPEALTEQRKMIGSDFQSYRDKLHHWTLPEVIKETENLAKQVKAISNDKTNQ